MSEALQVAAVGSALVGRLLGHGKEVASRSCAFSQPPTRLPAAWRGPQMLSPDVLGRASEWSPGAVVQV